MAATLDVISGGRLEFGLGAGYLEAEYRMYGLPFPPAAVRLAQLDEALRVCKLLWMQERADFAGQYFTLTSAICAPKPLQRPYPPIWIGGGGEQKTLRIVAEHADGWNAFPLPVLQLQHKLDVLRGHCQTVGRDDTAIRKQLVCTVITRSDPAQVDAELARFAAERHLPPERARPMVIAGTPEEVALALTPYLGIGFDMFLLMERTPLDHETLRLFMADVAPRLRAGT
jgi:alkanesulfonate monooxygenase SsuD/methylene tetrahydromethanopterin reductase-like flavin-dependent oxidoreductase (luciferase family)